MSYHASFLKNIVFEACLYFVYTPPPKDTHKAIYKDDKKVEDTNNIVIVFLENGLSLKD